jgi:glucose-1-phosphate thymidylyltransferase
MKGIVLAGGTGSRLWPITRGVSKQLLPVYDKPMIYYPISTLMLAGIKEILIICTRGDLESFKLLLGDGSNFGLRFSYKVQENPNGLAEALILGEDFLQGESCVLVLGDNIFYGSGLGSGLSISFPEQGCHIFTYEVENPSQYGVLELDSSEQIVSIKEKPLKPASNLAITGLYFFDASGVEIAKNVRPSPRGELEIISVIEEYQRRKKLSFTKLSRGTAWLDTGNPNSLHDAATFIRVIEERTGLKIACLEEISFHQGWLDKNTLSKIVDRNPKNDYWSYVAEIIQEKVNCS